MTDRWISQSEFLLRAMEKLSSKQGKDRLEIVNSMILALNALDRSVHGWRTWIQSLPLMSQFTEAELRDMEEGLTKRAYAFVGYDIEVTKKHMDKVPQITIARRSNQEDDRNIYV